MMDCEKKLSKHEFPTFDLFKAWKCDVEKKNGVQFVISQNYKIKKDGSKIIIYKCFRDGYQRSSAKIRKTKLLGSNKINGHCPAKIRMQLLADGLVNAEYQEVHAGHNIHEIGRLRLSKTEREGLAKKMSMKIPMEDILNGVQENIGNQLQRKDIVCRKDLHNIARDFNLSTTHIADNSVRAFVKENAENVLIFKQQGEISTQFPMLREEDFLLGIMTEAQMEIMSTFGNNQILMDCTHGFKSNFKMTTVMVFDQMHEGFPCAFMISNRISSEILQVFVKMIKERIKSALCPKVFMSDMTEEVYNSWVSVMGPAENRLFCAWHVRRAWWRNLAKIIGTERKEKKKTVFHMLCKILEEKNKEKFLILLNDGVRSMRNDRDTLFFGEYFEKEFVGKQRFWAYCHRSGLAVNTNTSLESMHGIMKNLFFEGKKLRRIDVALQALMQFFRNKFNGNITAANMGKLTNTMAVTRLRHKNGLKMERLVFQMATGVWEISAGAKNNKSYKIIKEKTSACCFTNCPECQLCIHQFKCSCPDSSIRLNMCKHVHYVKSKIDRQEVHSLRNTQVNSAEEACVAENGEVKCEEFHRASTASETLYDGKALLDDTLRKIRSKLNTLEKVKLAMEQLEKLTIMLEAMDDVDSLATQSAKKSQKRKSAKAENQKRFKYYKI